MAERVTLKIIELWVLLIVSLMILWNSGMTYIAEDTVGAKNCFGHWERGVSSHLPPHQISPYTLALIILHVHTSVAGSGFHLPSTPHTALIVPAGTNPGLHLKNISAPSSMFWNGSITPFPGTIGSLQLAEEEGEVKQKWSNKLRAFSLKQYTKLYPKHLIKCMQ